MISNTFLTSGVVLGGLHLLYLVGASRFARDKSQILQRFISEFAFNWSGGQTVLSKALNTMEKVLQGPANLLKKVIPFQNKVTHDMFARTLRINLQAVTNPKGSE